MPKNIEKKTAETILQEPRKYVLGGKEYTVAPPSIATLIMVSAAISEMPEMEQNPEDMVIEVLKKAKGGRAVADAAAILILGAKRIHDEERRKANILSALFMRKRDSMAKLADAILYECSPSEVSGIIIDTLGRQEVGDFFGLTTFLSGTNLTKKTRKVVKETTVYGR